MDIDALAVPAAPGETERVRHARVAAVGPWSPHRGARAHGQ